MNDINSLMYSEIKGLREDLKSTWKLWTRGLVY